MEYLRSRTRGAFLGNPFPTASCIGLVQWVASFGCGRVPLQRSSSCHNPCHARGVAVRRLSSRAGESGESFHFCGGSRLWSSGSCDSDDESEGDRSPIIIRAAKRPYLSARGGAEKRARILYLHLVTSQGKWQTSPLLVRSIPAEQNSSGAQLEATERHIAVRVVMASRRAKWPRAA